MEDDDKLKTKEEIDDLTIFDRVPSDTIDNNRKFQLNNNFTATINFNESIYPCFKSKNKINKLIFLHLYLILYIFYIVCRIFDICLNLNLFD